MTTALHTAALSPEALLHPTPKGLYCPLGDFYVDPSRKVERAVITHAHSDHARSGHGQVLATRETLDLMALRYGKRFTASAQALAYGESVDLGGVRMSLHPAGHVLGSAQIRIEHRGLVIVASGDFKEAADPTCAPFEPVRCDVFICEATFGLPVFRNPPAAQEVAKLLNSVRVFPERTHLVGAYSLGKAQRIMALLHQAGYGDPVYVHGAAAEIGAYYAGRGIDLGDVRPLPAEGAPPDARIVIGPPMGMSDLWARRFAEPVSCFASGWMRVRARQKGVGLPLIISDHADWDGLTETIRATGCSELWVTHGSEQALLHWAATRQLRARPLRLVGHGRSDHDEMAPSADGPAAETC